jgi:hypothetical protein
MVNQGIQFHLQLQDRLHITRIKGESRDLCTGRSRSISCLKGVNGGLTWRRVYKKWLSVNWGFLIVLMESPYLRSSSESNSCYWTPYMEHLVLSKLVLRTGPDGYLYGGMRKSFGLEKSAIEAFRWLRDSPRLAATAAIKINKNPVAVSVTWIDFYPAKSSARSRFTLRAAFQFFGT